MYRCGYIRSDWIFFIKYISIIMTYSPISNSYNRNKIVMKYSTFTNYNQSYITIKIIFLTLTYRYQRDIMVIGHNNLFDLNILLLPQKQYNATMKYLRVTYHYNTYNVAIKYLNPWLITSTLSSLS